MLIKNNKGQIKERLYLNENTKRGFKNFLLEVDMKSDLIEKAKQDPNIPIYLVGIIQKGDTPNRNGRIYPFDILKRECERYLNEDIKEGQSFLELDHPAESTVPEIKNAAATLEDIWDKGLEIWGKVKLLNAYASAGDPALKARNVILNEKTLGISSRALGSVYQGEQGYDMVEEDLEIICWDLVSKPSTYNANLRIVNEGKQSKNSLLLTESQCLGGNCSLKTSKQIIRSKKMQNLTLEEKTYLSILGVEKFLEIYRKNNK